jgi:ribonuclease P protein component
MPGERRFSYPRMHRLTGKLNFAAAYERGTRQARGPIVVFARANELSHPRLGLSVSRRVGTAAKRNVIKRRLREAFRFLQHDWPRGYDLVIVVRPHEPRTLAEYQKLLSGLMIRICAG